MLTDYHNHLENGSLSINYLTKFVDAAKEQGIAELGISEHAYHFQQTTNILSNPWVDERRWWDIKDYVKLFQLAWERGLDVKMSIEMDYTPGKQREMAEFIGSQPFDYVIGSVHWIGDFGVDLSKESWEGEDLYQIYQEYFDQVVTLAQSNLFDVIGHLDLVKIFGFIPPEEDFLLSQWDRVTTALARSKTCVEISTAGLRKPIGEIYPDPRLLRMCKAKNIPIVLSSDAHQPEHVGYGYKQAIALAKSVGYTTLITFNQGERKEVALG